jgi:hypothetical protein
MGFFMSKKAFFPLLLVAATVILSACKGTNESNGDKYLKDGKFRNAVNSYTNALQKGKVSKEFYDNFVLAYISSAKQTSKKNASDDIILSYSEQIFKNIPNVKNKAVIDSVVLGLSEIGVAQVSGGFEYEYTLQGFRNLDSAIAIAKRNGSNAAGAEAARKKAEAALVKQALENSEGAENSIAAEYVLLEAEVVAPKNPDLQKALAAVRVKNRDTYLIFAEEIIGQRASRYVDIYGYVLALPILNISPTGIAGEVSVWNATGNNFPFDPSKLRLVSKTGESVFAKYVGGGWCSIDKVDEKTGLFKSTNAPFKGSEGELRSEKTCNAKISFSYQKDFEPDYVAYVDSVKNEGKKYFGNRK